MILAILDLAAIGWLVFAGFLAVWLAADLWLYLTGRRTYSQAAYQFNQRYSGIPSAVFGAAAGFLIWHLFG